MRKLVLTDAMLVLGLGLIVAGMAINLKSSNTSQSKKLEIIKAGVSATPTPASSFLVDVSGEVIRPGVYKLGGEARINDVLVASGGLTAKADREWVEANINRAEKVRDGMKIFVPKINQQVPKNPSETDSTSFRNFQTSSTYQVPSSKTISLNTASLAQLDSLPKIGPVIGQRIIDYRTKNGGFKNVEELKLVTGIGDKMFEEIRDLITL
ncbi:MAG: ComEA family DNA-binding protein [Candidatus Shapirobacteria bacterium]